MRDRHPLYITLLWIIVVLVVNPFGDFPLNDDWSYGKAVQTLVQEGRFQLTDFTSMPLASQVVWGAIWCAVFGFSFTVLRVSTLVLAWMGLLALYRMLRDLGVAPRRALLGVLVLAGNPLFLSLAFTFMSDVPFMGFALISLSLFVRSRVAGAGRSRTAYLVGAVAMAVVATLDRQLGLFLPILFAAGLLLQGKFHWRKWIPATVGIAVVAGALWAYLAGLEAAGRMPALMKSGFSPPEHASWGAFWKYTMGHSRWALDYVGLFLLPLFLVSWPAWWQRLIHLLHLPSAGQGFQNRRFLRRWGPTIAAVGLFGYFLGTSLHRLFKLHGYLPDLVGNVWYDWGLGPVTLPGALPHPAGVPPHSLLGIVGALSVLGMLGRIVLFGMILVVTVETLRRITQKDATRPAWMAWAVLLGAGAYLLPLVTSWFFDRYLIPVVGLGVVFLLLPGPGAPSTGTEPGNRGLQWAARLALVLFLAFSVAGTKDYLAWNRARAAASEWVQQEYAVSHVAIDAGFEWNEWQRYNDPAITDPDREMLQFKDARFVVAAKAMEGCRIVHEIPYTALLSTDAPRVLVLVRNDRDTLDHSTRSLNDLAPSSVSTLTR